MSCGSCEERHLMQNKKESLNELHKLLESFIDKSFPKKCICGKIYANLQQFLSQTKETSATGNLLGPDDYEGTTAIELWRNCACGSTIMVVIRNRRDTSKEGVRLRKLFGEFLDELMVTGLEHETARQELLKVLCGKSSEILSKLDFSGAFPKCLFKTKFTKPPNKAAKRRKVHRQ